MQDPRTQSETADVNLDCAFVENALFPHRSLIVKIQQPRIELVTRPGRQKYARPHEGQMPEGGGGGGPSDPVQLPSAAARRAMFLSRFPKVISSFPLLLRLGLSLASFNIPRGQVRGDCFLDHVFLLEF